MSMINVRRPRPGLPALAILTFAVGLLLPDCAFSQVESASGADAAPARYQPAEFRTSRVEIRDEFQDLQGGGTAYLVTPRVDFSAGPELSFRIETPIVFTDSGTPNSDPQSGMGDILLRASYRVWHGAGYAIVAGSEAILDTATKDALGSGKNVVAPLIFASIDLPQYQSVVFPFLQHYLTLGGDGARRDVHYTSIKSAFLTRWPSFTYTIVEPQVIVDHEHADKIGLTLEGEIGHFLKRDTAIWLRSGVGLMGDDLPQVYDWKLEIGIRFFLH